jgi:hypothetical protein
MDENEVNLRYCIVEKQSLLDVFSSSKGPRHAAVAI